MNTSLSQLSRQVSLMLFFSLASLVVFTACDPKPLDVDDPILTPPTGLTVRGGESVTVSINVVAPGTIGEVTATATAGEVTVTNASDLVDKTTGTATLTYTTTKDISGEQTITLTVKDKQENSSNTTATIEVFAPVQFGLAMVSGASGVTTTFLEGYVDLDGSALNNASATELAQFAALYSDGKSLFTAGFGAPATMGKYVFNSSGDAVLNEQIIVPGSNSFSAIEIVDETKAYATVGGGISRAIAFSPKDMRITGEIDLSKAGDGWFYSDLLVRGNTLFIALNDFGGSGAAQIAVVDLNSDTLQKVITDDRTSTLFGTLTSSILTQDAEGNVYVQGSGLFSDKPSGILRIKAGETEFDSEYFFDLTAATGGTCFGLYHFGDGHTFTTVSQNDNNWFGLDGDNPAFRYRKINLSAATDGGDLLASLPNTFAASRTMFFQKVGDDEILFPIAGSNEDALYSYTLSTGEVTQKAVSNSGYVSGLTIIK